MTENKTSPGGIGFFGLLAVLFVGLKLTGYITWSWWWVMAPLWGPFLFVLIIFGIMLLSVGIVELLDR